MRGKKYHAHEEKEKAKTISMQFKSYNKRGKLSLDRKNKSSLDDLTIANDNLRDLVLQVHAKHQLISRSLVNL